MSAREWKPGDVARVQLSVDRTTHVAEYQGRGKWQGSWNGFSVETEKFATIRPLAVIDPEDREQVERLRDHCWQGGTIEHWQDHLREFANPTPPKPDEPHGLGAVVEDADGNHWVREHPPTCPDNSSCIPWRVVWPDCRTAEYDDIDAVKVLAPGWSE